MTRRNLPASLAFSTASPDAVTVPAAGNTELLIIPCSGLERIFVQFSVATQALDAFLIQARSSPEASFTTLYSAAADYTLPTGRLVGAGTSGATADLTTVAAGGTGWFDLEVRGLYEVKVLASAAVNNAAVTIYMGGQ